MVSIQIKGTPEQIGEFFTQLATVNQPKPAPPHKAGLFMPEPATPPPPGRRYSIPTD